MTTVLVSPFLQNKKMPAPNVDRLAELKAFDATKVGVKGLVDAGLTKIPPIFVHPAKDCVPSKAYTEGINFPTVDLYGIDTDPELRKIAVKKVHDALDTWGFFKVVNHGVPQEVMDEMIEGVRRFFEQDEEIKKKYYSREYTNNWMYNSNFDLYIGESANWRDTFSCLMAPYPPKPETIPITVREIIVEYSNQIMKVARTLFELVSETLGLKPSYLNEIGCADGVEVLGNYYPACPQPELTTGIVPHADNDFLTILLQDHYGGLQVRHQDEWYDVPPTPGALVVNSGELLQYITNDKYKSVEHKKLASTDGPRISIASFVTTGHQPSERVFRPIKEILSESNPARYGETTVREYAGFHKKKGLGGISALEHYRLNK